MFNKIKNLFVNKDIESLKAEVFGTDKDAFFFFGNAGLVKKVTELQKDIMRLHKYLGVQEITDSKLVKTKKSKNK